VVVTDKLGNVARESVVFMHGVTHASRRHRRHH
jgi:hypothetical protein